MTIKTLCQFNALGVLQKHDIDITKNTYLAISHIWMDAAWTSNIPNIPWKILASAQKARFLETRLRDVVGGQYFWMDILCVDQASADARIDIAKYIPSIYRGAEKTIIIRESGGFKDCCANAITAGTTTWMGRGKQNFNDHVTKAHRFGMPVEMWLDRLWVLEEVLMSDTLQFVVCDSDDRSEDGQREESWDNSYIWNNVTYTTQLRDKLQAVAFAWTSYGSKSAPADSEIDEFVHAFLHYGTVTRRAVISDRHRQRSPYAEFRNHGNSMRRTTKARDFILAILPQYGWYVAPPNIRGSSFGALWLDCCKQANASGNAFYPRITKGMIEPATSADDSRLATSIIPDPTCLGDFVKLFGGIMTEYPIPHWGREVNELDLVEIDPGNIDLALAIIRDSMDFSHEPWFFGVRGDLVQHGVFPYADLDNDLPADLDPEPEARKGLGAMWYGIFEQPVAMFGDWNYYRLWLTARCSRTYCETLLRLAALLGCGLGVSAVAWSRDYLLPVVATIQGHRMLALVSKRYWDLKPEKEGEVRDSTLRTDEQPFKLIANIDVSLFQRVLNFSVHNEALHTQGKISSSWNAKARK